MAFMSEITRLPSALTSDAQVVAGAQNTSFQTDRLALEHIAREVGIANELPADTTIVLSHEPKPQKRSPLSVDQPQHNPHDIVVRSELDEQRILTGVADRLFTHPVFNPSVARWYRTRERLERFATASIITGIGVVACAPFIQRLHETEGIEILSGAALITIGGIGHLASSVRSIISEPQRPPVKSAPPVTLIHGRN